MLLDGLGRVFIGSMFGDRLVWSVQLVENSAQPTQLLVRIQMSNQHDGKIIASESS
jgi:hypothetical protein